MRNSSKTLSQVIKYSAIIPTFNGKRKIHHALNSLLRQSIDPTTYEIIVVDDGSIDDTRGVVHRYQRQYPNHHIVYLRQENSGPATARNTGIRHASGEILFFTDDDCEVPALWMEKILEIYRQHPEVVGVGGNYSAPLYETVHNPFHQFLYLTMCHFWGWNMEIFHGMTGEIPQHTKVMIANTGNLSVKKWLVERVGLFEEQFRLPWMEDYELCERIEREGYILYRFPIDVLHHKKVNFRKIVRFAFVRGRGERTYMDLKDRTMIDRPFTTPIFTAYKRFKRFCNSLEVFFPGFRYDRRVLPIAFLYIFVRKIANRLPHPRPAH